jgi:predicted nucleotidyltransferase component of viral defense system
MIPTADILAWRGDHPWTTNAQVEQDLIISRAMVDIFSDATLREQLAMRGGTALHKLYLNPATRYSEDIDLVQTRQSPIVGVMDGIHGVLDPWLGPPKWEQNTNDIKFIYKVLSEIAPVATIKIKIEINTREHVAAEGVVQHPFAVASRWFSGAKDIQTFSLEELLGTKMRALFQRRKGRDLYDIWLGLTAGKANTASVAEIFQAYMRAEGRSVTRAEFSANLAAKVTHAGFLSDVPPLLRPGMMYDPHEAHQLLEEELFTKL